MRGMLLGLFAVGALPVFSQPDDPEAIARPWREYWKAHRAQCEADIEAVRKSDGRIVITDEDGRPMPGAECLIRQTGSDFVWGCSGLSLGQLGSMEAAYEAKLSEIFNMVTTTFCPGVMRPTPDEWRFDADSREIYRRPPSDRVLRFCREHGMRMKGQPLMCDRWHPKWAMKQTKAEAEAFYHEWFRGVADRYGKTVWYFDVVNEAFDTKDRTPDFPLYGGDEELPFVDWAFAEAEKVFPTNCILGINMGIHSTEWDDGPRGGKRYFRLCKRIVDSGHRLDAIGFQCHLFSREHVRQALTLKRWNPDLLRESYRVFATLGRPLYINEITIPAILFPGAAGEAVQAEIAEDLYRFWFSCKELKGVTWWNLFDGATWIWEGDANGALLDRAMREKPVYAALRRLIKREFNTSFQAKAGDDGSISFRGFRGTYEAIVKQDEKLRTIRFTLTEKGVVPDRPAEPAVVSFKDAAKIRSWDAWEDHVKKGAQTNILQKEKKSVTWEKFNKADPGLKELGRVRTRTSMEIKSSKWSVDCCTLDRDYAVWDNYKDLLPMLGAKHARFCSGWAKTEQEKGVYDFTWLDKPIRECAAMGIRPWMLVGYGNPVWGSDFRLGMRVKQLTDNPEAMEAWIRYVKALVARYQDVVDGWEVWNEPFKQEQEYAELFYRTAKAIREVQPAAHVYCAAMSDFPQYEAVLERLKKENAIGLCSGMMFHPYGPNPDDTYRGKKDAWMQLRRLAKRYSPDLDMIQGEVGSPSQLEFAHALARREWTEYKQAKYDLRRAFGDAARDVPSNCFSFIDLQYTFMLQSFGLVRSNALKEFVYRRPSWYAMRNFYALFDDDTKAVSFEERTVGGHTLAVATFSRAGKTMKAFWFSEEVPTDSLAFTRLDLSGDVTAGAEWIEMVTGRRYRLDDPRSVPVWDSPCLVMQD